MLATKPGQEIKENLPGFEGGWDILMKALYKISKENERLQERIKELEGIPKQFTTGCLCEEP